ncbi:putative shuttle craft, partial [Operophtera brumata]
MRRRRVAAARALRTARAGVRGPVPARAALPAPAAPLVPHRPVPPLRGAHHEAVLRRSRAPSVCECGAAVLLPPVHCGQRAPACEGPCLRARPCLHPPHHSCHTGECPPCVVLTTKRCYGGHEMYPTLHREATCLRACLQRGLSLVRLGRERSRRLPQCRPVPAAGARHLPLRAAPRRALLQRERAGLRQMALALQIRNPDVSAKLAPRYSEHKRQFIHELCEHFGCESVAYDAEPNRNVVATADKEK